MQAARLDAIERGLTQHVHVLSGARWCWSVSESPGCGCEEHLRCQRIRAVAPQGGGVVLESDTRLRFEPTAETRTTPVDLPMSNAFGDRLTVSLTPMGRSRICTPGSPGMGYPAC